MRAEDKEKPQAPKTKSDTTNDATKVRVDSPKESAPAVPQGPAVASQIVASQAVTSPAVAPKAVPTIKKNILWTKNRPVVRKQAVRVEEEQLRPARKRKMDVIEDAITDRPPKRSMGADGQKRTSPPQTKKPETYGSSADAIVSSENVKESNKAVSVITTGDAAADSMSMSSAEGPENDQGTTPQVKTPAVHIDCSSPASSGLEMPPTPGRFEESQYFTDERDSTTEMAGATNEEAGNVQKSSEEESTAHFESLFIESSSASESLLEDSSNDIDAPSEENPDGSSKATTPD